MKKKKLTMTFCGDEFGLVAYAVETGNTVDIKTGEYFDGALHVSIQFAYAESLYTDKYIYNTGVVEGDIQINNEFSGEIIKIKDATLVSSECYDMGIYSTQLSFKFRKKLR